MLTTWRLVRCNPTAGYGLDEPQWPPPAYGAGSGQLRTLADDEASRARARVAEPAEGDGDGDSDAGSSPLDGPLAVSVLFAASWALWSLL